MGIFDFIFNRFSPTVDFTNKTDAISHLLQYYSGNLFLDWMVRLNIEYKHKGNFSGTLLNEIFKFMHYCAADVFAETQLNEPERSEVREQLIAKAEKERIFDKISYAEYKDLLVNHLRETDCPLPPKFLTHSIAKLLGINDMVFEASITRQAMGYFLASLKAIQIVNKYYPKIPGRAIIGGMNEVYSEIDGQMKDFPEI